MKPKTKLYAIASGIVLIFCLWAIFLHFYPAQELVDKIGIQNTYLVAFLLAIIGGFSSLTGTSLYAALIALAHGGVNPTMLGIVSGLGLFVSDTVFYLVITHVRSLITKVTTRWERLFRRMWKWFYVMPDWIVYGGIFLYSALAPVPNDILLAVLALSSYSYRQFAVFLLAGDLTMTLLLTHIGSANLL